LQAKAAEKVLDRTRCSAGDCRSGTEGCRNRPHDFIFVREDGAGLERISDIFAEKHIEASVDEVFPLSDVSKALQKVAAGKSKGKTIIKI